MGPAALPPRCAGRRAACAARRRAGARAVAAVTGAGAVLLPLLVIQLSASSCGRTRKPSPRSAAKMPASSTRTGARPRQPDLLLVRRARHAAHDARSRRGRERSDADCFPRQPSSLRRRRSSGSSSSASASRTGMATAGTRSAARVLGAAAWGLVLRWRPLAWATAAVVALTTLLGFVHLHDRPSGLRLLEPKGDRSVWNEPDWRLPGDGQPAPPRALPVLRRDVPLRDRVAVEPEIWPGAANRREPAALPVLRTRLDSDRAARGLACGSGRDRSGVGAPSGARRTLRRGLAAGVSLRTVARPPPRAERDLPLSMRLYTRRVPKPRLLVFVVAYNAERTIEDVLTRIPHTLADDSTSRCSSSTTRRATRTFERGQELRTARRLCRSRCTCSTTRSTRATAATRRSASTTRSSAASTSSPCSTATGSTRPSACPSSSRRSPPATADAVLGSRMLERGRRAARRHAALQVRRQQDPDDVPEPRCCRRRLSEFHSGYRVYSVDALRRDPVRAQHERLPLRHGDHHPARARAASASTSCRSRRTTATRSATSTASSTRGDVTGATLNARACRT